MIRKQSFQRRENHKNGLLLQVQYMVTGPSGDVLRSKFSFASFNKNGERLAVVDHRHSLFIIDFSENKFWLLRSLTSCTLLSFCQENNDVLIGLSSGNLALFNHESGEEITKLTGHKRPPSMFSFSSDGQFCLTAAPTEGIIWHMKTKTPVHCLILQQETIITQVLFMPVSNNILACFQDNVIHVWQLGSFECVKQIIPDAWEGRQIISLAFTRNGRAMVLGGESLQLVLFRMDDWSAQKIIELPEWFGGVLKLEFIADLFDGGANKILAVLGINSDLCFLDVESAQALSKLVLHGVESFLCSPSGKYLSCTTDSRDVKVFSLAKILNRDESRNVAESAPCVSPDDNQDDSECSEGSARTKPFSGRRSPGSLLSKQISELNITDEGPNTVQNEEHPSAEVNKEPFSSNLCREESGLVNNRDEEPQRKNSNKRFKKSNRPVRHSAKDHLEAVNAKIEKVIDSEKVHRILREFGELPELYRSVIWRTLLHLPHNIEIYRCLVERGIHPAWSSLSETYNITNKTLLKSLQSILSCLTHWCPAIAELPYMPHFVFPFVRFFHTNSFSAFEAVMTIIVNWCQHWFEFLSFPPINILAMIENALAEYDPKVLNIFYDAGITTKQYAWPLLYSAFSEVLSPKEWLRFWDHVLINPPWFLILAVVAYNSCCRVALKTCTSEQDFEFFFHHQNPIDMNQFMNKTYELCENLSSENHPRQYLSPFQPLPQGNYPVLTGFPKFIVDYKNQQRNAILREEEELVREERELLQKKLKMEEEYRTKELKSVQQARLRNLEESTRKAIKQEEERLRQKRRELSALHADIRSHEHQLISKAQSQMEEELSRQRCARIAEMQEQLESKTKDVDFEQETLYNEQQSQFSRLAALRRELQIRLENVSSEARVPDRDSGVKELIQQINQLTEKLRKTQEIANRKQYASSRKISGKIAEMERLNEERDLALAKEAFKVQDYLLKSQRAVEGVDLDSKSRDLQMEIQKMLKDLEAAYLQRCQRSDAENSARPKSSSSHCPRNGISSSVHSSVDTSGLSISNGRRLHRTGESCSLRNKTSYLGNLPPVRSEEFYRREKAAINSAMKLRAGLSGGIVHLEEK